MNMLREEARTFCATFAQKLNTNEHQGADIWIAPPFTTLRAVRDELNDFGIPLGAQNVHWEESGAFTGEISSAMLVEAGVSFVIVGHSERRQFFGETDETVSLRAKAAIDAGLDAIVCVGELKEEFEAGKTEEVVLNQLNASLAGLSPQHAEKLKIAYEPVWAIGTGLAATPEIAANVHNLIRNYLVEKFPQRGPTIRLLYGGSTKPENISELCAQENINGTLVGGCSLKPDMFYQLALNGLRAK